MSLTCRDKVVGNIFSEYINRLPLEKMQWIVANSLSGLIFLWFDVKDNVWKRKLFLLIVF